MPETPDFDLIALQIMGESSLARFKDPLAAIAEQLRLVWNARGAADIAKIDTTLTYVSSGSPDAGIVKTLDRALRTLDR